MASEAFDPREAKREFGRIAGAGTYPGCVSATGACTAIATPAESPGDRIYNFTRVEVPGDGDVHWILAHVRSDKRNPFAFEFRLVPGN